MAPRSSSAPAQARRIQSFPSHPIIGIRGLVVSFGTQTEISGWAGVPDQWWCHHCRTLLQGQTPALQHVLHNERHRLMQGLVRLPANGLERLTGEREFDPIHDPCLRTR